MKTKRNYWKETRSDKNKLEEYQAKKRVYWQKVRYEVLSHYSNGIPICNCCGETENKFLALDHKNNDGNIHRKTMAHCNMIRWAKSNNFPDMFQVLCHNCNMAKALYKICPHKLSTVSIL